MQPSALYKTFNTARIISVAIMASVFLYVGLAEFFLKDHVNVSFSGLDLFRIALYIISGIEVGIIIWLRNFLLRKPTSPPPGIMDRLKPQANDRNPQADEQESIFSQRLLSATIIIFSLSESIAIYGLVLFIIGKQRQDLYLLTGLALILMIVFFPRFDDWKFRLDEFKRDEQNHEYSNP